MIIKYNNGKDFVLENKSFLDKNKYMSSLFYIDAKVLNEVNLKNYVLKVINNDKELIGLKVEPYNLLLYGAKECLKELLEYLNDNDYEYKGVMCSTEIGEELIKVAKDIIRKDYFLKIGMDFMEATECFEESANEVKVASSADLDDIYHNSISFIKDCGLTDKVDKDKIAKRLSNYRVFKIDGKVVSMAAFSYDTIDSLRITHVYTVPKYRGKGYARKVVNAVKNEIILMGKIATLNVDQANPISNHLYKSLGFKKVFSQGIYDLK